MAITLKIVNGDIVDDAVSGQPVTISGRDALRQHVAENLVISRQANGFGAGIVDLVGTVPIDSYAMEMLVQTQLQDSFTAMRILQTTASNISLQSNEILSDSYSVTVQQDSQDPRTYLYSVKLLTEEGKALVARGAIQR